MSEIRSQATPARDELAAVLMKLWGWLGPDAAKMLVEQVEAAGWSKPRMVNSTVELMALPLGSLIRALLHGNQSPGTVFERVGKEWLELDPSDRGDGEQTIPSAAIFRVYKHGVFVLFTPGGE
ncbi:hypothetical protein ACIQYW_14075 [Rhodococcus erythropolis]|uniref:hypothetical protein n=1 Tax=Rhodococcus baikonurensis TaxID=172041 RepID=UPI00339844EA